MGDAAGTLILRWNMRIGSMADLMQRRLLVKCWYTDATEGGSKSGNPTTVLPPLVDVVPGFSSSIPTSVTNKSWDYNLKTASPTQVLSVDDQVSVQVHRLLSAISRKRGYVVSAFQIAFALSTSV